MSGVPLSGLVKLFFWLNGGVTGIASLFVHGFGISISTLRTRPR